MQTGDLMSDPIGFVNALWRKQRKIANAKLDPNFGYETKGAAEKESTTIRLRGCKFTCPESGTADSITIYLKQSGAITPKIKCAIYEDDAGYPEALVGYTEEWTLTSGWDDWKTFNIVSGGSLTADTVYWLVVWADDAFYYYRDAGEANQRVSKYVAYNSFPDTFPADGAFGSYKISIYCTYSVAPPAGGVLAQIF